MEVWFLIGLLILLVIGTILVAQVSKPPRSKRRKAPPQKGETRTRPETPRVSFGRGAKPLTWFGPGASFSVAGFNLRDPCVYASFDPSQRRLWATDPSEILLQAEVRRPAATPPEMGYWPWYSRIEPENRYAYLSWLATGKQGLPPAEGLLFLYYYGLERRLLVDNQDRGWVLGEVERLKKLDEQRRGSREGASFRRYSTGLLWFEVARAPESFDEKGFRKVCALTDQWTSDNLPAALAWLARRDRPLPPDIARRVAQCDPRAQRSVVVRRVGDKFDALFAKRYQEEYGQGLRLKVAKGLRPHSYQPASGGLNEVSCTIANPMGIPSQFGRLADLWNSCVDDLRKLSRVSAAPTGAGLTIESWEAMPTELRAGVDHPLASSVQAIVVDGSRDGQECLVAAGQLAGMLRLQKRLKLTAAQSRRVAETVESAGYSVEPDTRMTGRAYGWDDRVAVFLRTDDTEPDTGRYLGASCMLYLAMVVAEADGTVDDKELRCLTQRVEASFHLPEHERRRLEALMALLRTTRSDIGSVARRVEQSLSLEARQAVGRLIVAVAGANGVIDRAELTALRKCYRALGLGPDLLEQTLAALSPASGDGLVTVQPGRPPARGEAIQAPAELRLVLDRAAITAIMAETQEVAKLLADAMIVEDEEQSSSSSITVVDHAPATLSGEAASSSTVRSADSGGAPPSRYAAFYSALVARGDWPQAEASNLARQHGLMLAGAIEAINEWAIDELGGPLLDETDGKILVDQSLIAGRRHGTDP